MLVICVCCKRLQFLFFPPRIASSNGRSPPTLPRSPTANLKKGWPVKIYPYVLRQGWINSNERVTLEVHGAAGCVYCWCSSEWGSKSRRTFTVSSKCSKTRTPEHHVLFYPVTFKSHILLSVWKFEHSIKPFHIFQVNPVKLIY